MVNMNECINQNLISKQNQFYEIMSRPNIQYYYHSNFANGIKSKPIKEFNMCYTPQ